MPENAAQSDDEGFRKEVEGRAYALWESEGRPHGRDLDHWLQAETEIMALGKPGSSVNAPDPTASPPGRKTKAESSAA